MVSLTNFNYNEEFISNLLKEVEKKIAVLADKDYKNQVYDLGLNLKLSNHTDLLDIKNILEKILKCDSCYSEDDIKIEDVIFLVKNKLNKC